MKKDTKRRLVGAFGGGGGALALGTLLSYYVIPELWDWRTVLSFGIIGVILIIMAVLFI